MMGALDLAEREVSVTGDYVERAYQSVLHDGFEGHRNSIVIAHRRAGKTVSIVTQLIRDAFACPHQSPQCAYIAPTYGMAKRIAWKYFRAFLRDVPGVVFREGELSIELPGDRWIYLLGSENPDRLRGMYLDSACVDEAADCPESLLGQVLRPALADREGKLYLIGTVKGRNYFWRLYERARASSDWFTANLLPEDTQALPESELALMRREMSEDEYRSEMRNDPAAAVRGSYWGAAMAQLEEGGQICSVPHDSALPVVCAMDLGIADSTAIWLAQLHRGGEIRLLESMEYQNTSFLQILGELQARPYQIQRWIGPHDLAVREYTTGQSRADAARELGIAFEIAPRMPVIDGIEAVRRALPRCWFDRQGTLKGRDSLALYRSEYDEKRRVLSRNPVHDWTSHAADAFRYLIVTTSGGRQRSLDLAPIDYTNSRGHLG
jgi:phage terminase large subunit